MSFTSPAPLSVQPLALFTSRVGSYCLIQSTIRGVSYWPQPSLNGTHMTMRRMIAAAVDHALQFELELLADSDVALSVRLRRRDVLSPLGMSCQTSRPSLSHQ